MPSAAPVLRVAGICVRREGKTILDDVDWCVEHGQHWVLIGANGSGKTSLLNTLTAYLSPTRGSVEVLGHRYGETDWRELRKSIGIVTTAVPTLMPAGESALRVVLSGTEAMIGFYGEPQADALERARQILAQVECTELESRPWRVLSQGERQRLLIGRALIADPPLLILDEPCAGLDPVARERFLDFLGRLGKKLDAPTLVFVTHHVEEIIDVFTHVLLLRAGRVLAAGPKSEVLTSDGLAEAFATSVELEEKEGRYVLRVEPNAEVIS